MVGLEQVGQALALLEAPDEQDVQRAVAQLLERLGAREPVEVDAVGNDPVLAGEVAVDEVPRRPADGDPAVELVRQVPGESAADPVAEG